MLLCSTFWRYLRPPPLRDKKYDEKENYMNVPKSVCVLRVNPRREYLWRVGVCDAFVARHCVKPLRPIGAPYFLVYCAIVGTPEDNCGDEGEEEGIPTAFLPAYAPALCPCVTSSSLSPTPLLPTLLSNDAPVIIALLAPCAACAIPAAFAFSFAIC